MHIQFILTHDTKFDLKTLNFYAFQNFDSHKTERKFTQVKHWLSHVNKGIIQNSIINPDEILLLLKQTLVPMTAIQKSPVQVNQRRSTYEINPPPSKKVKEGPDAVRILIEEFSLQCLYNLLNNEKVSIDDAKEFRAVLVQTITSNSKEVCLTIIKV